MPANFEPGPLGGTPLMSLHRDVLDDLTNFLPAAAAERVFRLRDDTEAAHRQLIDFETQREARADLTRAEQRLDRLLAHQSQSGFGLAPDDVRVTSQTAEVNRLSAALERLSKAIDKWSGIWRVRSQVVTMVEQWLHDRPSGTTLEPVETEIKLGKNETIPNAIARERALAKSLIEKRSNVASRPFPPEYAKRRLCEVIDQRLAVPDITPLVRFDQDPVFPPRHTRIDVIGTDRPALGMLHTDDAVGMLLWACRDAVIEKLDALIDASDTRGALDPAERERLEGELTVELLEVEMRLGALVWRGKTESLPVEFDPQMSPLAMLRTLPKPLPGTSPEHVIERVGGH